MSRVLLVGQALLLVRLERRGWPYQIVLWASMISYVAAGAIILIGAFRHETQTLPGLPLQLVSPPVQDGFL